MSQPSTLAELLSYLSRHPWVFAACDDPRVPPLVFGLMEFDFRANGGLYFRAAADGRPRYVPLSCGWVRSETGLSFHPGRFEVLKFGLTIRYHYVSPLLTGGLARCKTTAATE